MATTLRELLVKIGVDADDKVVQKFDRAVDGAKKRLISLTKAAAAGASALAGLAGLKLKAARDTAEYATEITRMARSLDITTDAAQELLSVFERFDGDASDVKDAFATITDRAEDAKGGMQSYIDDFKLVGIAVKDLKNKKPEQLFELFAESVAKTKDPNKRLTAAVRILGDDLGNKLLPLLLQGKDGLAAMRKEARDLGAVLDKDALEKSARFNFQLQRLDQLVKGVRNRLSVALMPKLEEAARKTVDWAVANKEVIEQKIEKWVEKLEDKVKVLIERIRELGGGDFAAGLKRVGQIIASIVGAFAGLKIIAVISGLVSGLLPLFKLLGAIGLAGFAKIAAIVLWTVGAWTTLFLVVEDFITYLRGGDSIIGRVLARIQSGQGILGGFYMQVQEAIDRVKAFFAGLGKGERIIDRVFDLARAKSRMVSAAIELLRNIAYTAFVAMGRIGQAVFEKIQARALPILETIGGIARDVFTFMRNVLWLVWEKAGKPVLEFFLTAFTTLYTKIAEGLEWVNTNWGPVFNGAMKVTGVFIKVITAAFDVFFDYIDEKLGKFKEGWAEFKSLPGINRLFDEDFDPSKVSLERAPVSVVANDMRARAGAAGAQTNVRVGGITAPINIDARGMAPNAVGGAVRRGLSGAREDQLAGRFGNGE